MRWCLGTMSEALLKSVVVRSVLRAGFAALRPSRNIYVMCVRGAYVEWLGQRPYCAGEIGICSVMFCRSNFSSILERWKDVM